MKLKQFLFPVLIVMALGGVAFGFMQAKSKQDGEKVNSEVLDNSVEEAVDNKVIEEKENIPKTLKAAIFVQNRAGREFDDYVDVLNDLLTAHLTGRDGFAIVDKSVVVDSFKASQNVEPSVEMVINSLAKIVQGIKTESPVENFLSNASAVRISQLLNADYLIIATITTYNQSTKSFNGANTPYGIDGTVTNVTLRVSLKVLEGTEGTSLVSDIVTVADRFSLNKFRSIDDGYIEEIKNKLFAQAATEISNKVLSKIDVVREAKVKDSDLLDVTITSNIEGATVSVDGAVIGTVNSTFKVKPGIHTLTVSKERYVTKEHPVFFNQSGQVINIALEYSAEGARRSEVELQNKLVEDVIREQSAAQAYSRTAKAEGKKKMLENSSVKVDIGKKVETLAVGGDFDVVPE